MPAVDPRRDLLPFEVVDRDVLGLRGDWLPAPASDGGAQFAHPHPASRRSPLAAAVVAGPVITGAPFKLDAGTAARNFAKNSRPPWGPNRVWVPVRPPVPFHPPRSPQRGTCSGGGGPIGPVAAVERGKGLSAPAPVLPAAWRAVGVSPGLVAAARPAPHPCGVLDVVPGPGPSVLRPPAETPAFRMACATMYIMRQLVLRKINGLGDWPATEGANKHDSCASGKIISPFRPSLDRPCGAPFRRHR